MIGPAVHESPRTFAEDEVPGPAGVTRTVFGLIIKALLLRRAGLEAEPPALRV